MTDVDGHRPEELARRAQEGGEDAFRDLARSILGRVRRWALGIRGHPDLADEVTQRVLIRLHRHLPSYDPGCPFRPWIHTLTRNAALTLLRSERPHVELDQTLAAPKQDPLGRIASDRLAELVRVLFTKLPERQREVFDLVDLQGFEPSEIAQLLELSPATVRVHLHRARATLRTEILKHHPELRERYVDDV